MGSKAIQDLAAAIENVLYTSEIDQPLEIVSMTCQDPPTDTEIRRLGNHDEQAPVREISLDDFFGTQDATDSKIANLRRVIERSLSCLKAFRVGEVQVTYYVIGKVGDRWTGVKAKAVETG